MSEEKNVQDFCSDDEVIAPPAETEEVTAPEEENAGYPEQTETENSAPEEERHGGYFDTFPNGPALHHPPSPSVKEILKKTSGNSVSRELIDGMIEENRAAFAELTAKNEALAAQNDTLLAANESLQAQLDSLGEKLDRLTAQVVNTNRAVTMHETIEGNLNKELQNYKNDFYGKLATPFLMQMISLCIEMTKELEELLDEIAASEEPTGHEDVVSSLSYYVEKIRGSLVNSGVEMERPEEGEKMDPLKHQIVRTIPSDDPEMNGVIESVRSSTYTYNNKILLRAKVAVYKSK